MLLITKVKKKKKKRIRKRKKSTASYVGWMPHEAIRKIENLRVLIQE
jgi:hypothetical protein